MRFKLKSLIGSFLLVLPTAGYTAPVVPASQPLFLTAAVKHNIMLGIDDSSSMDSEVLLPTNDGALWLNSNGSFSNLDGDFVRGPGLPKYTYLFPNGSATDYTNGAAIAADDHYAVPPIRAYAFTRSSSYNRAYYDPSETYRSWPSFGTISYPEYSGRAAPFDPNKYDADIANSYLDLASDLSTGTKGEQWDFDILADNMACGNADATNPDDTNCIVGDKDYTYWPATYWVLDTSSEIQFYPDRVGGESFHAGNSKLIEAESAFFKTSGNDYSKASEDSSISRGVLVNSASGGDYIATNDGAGNDGPSESLGYGQVSFSFNVPESGAYQIWIRKFSKDDNTDSLWVNLQGFGPADTSANAMTIYGENTFVESLGESWVKWWRGLTQANGWTWDRVATANLSSGVGYTLRIRPREAYVPVDQLLITKVTDQSPSGAMSLLPAPQQLTLSCSGSSAGYYDIFRRSPGAFNFPGDADSDFALTPDGKCLRRIEISDTRTSYPSGRSYTEELQNFSNWFTYYRRHHQAMRGGLASAFQGIGGMQAGVYWTNRQDPVVMYDLDTVSDKQTFLGNIYGHVGSGETALRSTLNYSRTQYRRTDNAPIQYACQKNFTVLATGGYATDTNFTGPGNADGGAGTPYQDSYSNTLADIAFEMYSANPRPAPAFPEGAVSVPAACNDVNPPASLDCNDNLHINTYTVGLGAKGTIFGQSYTTVEGDTETYDRVGDVYAVSPAWPDVSSAADTVQIDDLYHAAVNGRGEIYNPDTPGELQTELSATIRDIVSSLGSASGVTFNSATLESDSLIFSALFNATSWSGDVEARALNPSSGAISSTRAWSAAEQLSGQAPSERVILSYNNTSKDGVPFQWASLDAGQQADLNIGPSGASDSFGEQRLAYLRGDTSNEGQQLRNRDGLLGDIVNSTPLFVGAPRMNWPDAAPFGTEAFRYSAFRGNADNVDRTPMVYVGANDGMLHGFKSVESALNGGGDELIAYVPRSIFSTAQRKGLHYLTDPAYSHQYYVDLSPQAVDVYMPASPGGTTAWRTVLIGGLRGAGAGIFALDVTNPSNFSEANASDLVLWEFDDTDFLQMNYQLEQSVVVMMNNDRWALVLGNGFNNGDGTNAADNETGLLILYMDGGLDGEWTNGANGTPNDYDFIKVGDTGGLGAVNAIDTDGDRVVDRIYGGDLEGNLWAFDVSGSNNGNWGAAYTTGTGNLVSAAPLFRAALDTNNDGVNDTGQPISQRPLVLRNTLSPEGTEGGAGEDYLIYFGTGKYFGNGDLADQSLQSMYGVWDRGDAQLGRENLQVQLIDPVTVSGRRTVNGGSIDWAGETAREYGWYMDLPEAGERVLNSAKFRGEILFFETYTPNSDACASGGSSWFMSVTMGGLDPLFAVFDENNDGFINGEDVIYAGQQVSNSSTGATGILGNSQYFQNIDGEPDQREVDFGEDSNRAGRLGWRELIDF